MKSLCSDGPRVASFAAKGSSFMNRQIGTTLLSALVVLLPTLLHAATVAWVGGSGDWDTATYWSTGALPGPNDDVVIGSGPGITVTHSTGADSVNSILSQQAFVLSGGSLAVSTTFEASNTFTLSGGTLQNATVVTTNGAGLIVNSGTLDGVTINGVLDVGNSVDGARLTVLDGLTLNGTMLVGNPTNGSSGRALFRNASQTLGGSGTVVFGNYAANFIAGYDNATLTIGAGITVHGQNGYVGVAGNGSIINQGTISCDVNGGLITSQMTPPFTFVNQGMLAMSNGGQLDVQGLVGNLGQMSPITNGAFTLSGTYTNNLALNVTNGGTLNLNGNWVNTGTIDATNATVNLGGDFTVAGLGVFNRSGGAVNLTGLLDNTNTTLAFNASTGSWVLNGGTVAGGTISETNGAELIVSAGTLDGVTVDGTLDVGNSIGGAVLTVLDGLTLNGTMLVGNPSQSGYY